jgi:PadR family transcriptional regulator PadR
MEHSMKPNRSDLLAGSLDLLILKTLSLGTLHGYGIAQQIRQLSSDALRIEEGSLYPALQRLEAKGFTASEWRRSPAGRRARYYHLTPAGRKHLGLEAASFFDSVGAISRVLRGAEP